MRWVFIGGNWLGLNDWRLDDAMATIDIECEVTLTDRGREMASRLTRIASQAKQGNRRKMSRLMRRGRDLAYRYFRGAPLIRAKVLH